MDNQLKDVVVPYGEYADEFSVGVHSAHHSLTYKWHTPGNFLNKKVQLRHYIQCCGTGTVSF